METVNLIQDAFIRNASKNLARWHAGSLFVFLAGANDTNGEYALLENLLRKGVEPPVHTHTREDETFYLLEGEIDFYAGDKHIPAKKGDLVYLPKNIPHSFKVKTATAKVLLLITPAGLEEFFIKTSVPAGSFELPPLTGAPTPEQKAAAGKLSADFGIIL